MVERGEADAKICGLVGRFHKKLGYLRSVFDFDKGVTGTAAMTADQRPGRVVLPDTHAVEPTAEQIAEATLQASSRPKFGIEPKIALLSHSNYGSHDNPSAAKMRRRGRSSASVPLTWTAMMADTAGRRPAQAHLPQHHADRPPTCS
jgi:malate dehydrogenase (oxaloacetate-decarboxylating)(NADP+)